MLPDATVPPTCPVCGASEHATIRNYSGIGNIVARHFECGASIAAGAAGDWRPALGCPKAGNVVAALRTENARLRADNVRVGDRNVLLATELQAIADAAEEQLDDWLPVVIEQLPGYLHFAREVLDWATEALEGEPRPSAAVGVAPGEPAKAGQGLSVTAASAHSGGVS